MKKLARVLAHAALLVTPVAALGRLDQLLRPQGIACVLLAVLLGEVEAGSRGQPDPSRARAPGTRLALASALGLLVTTWAAIASPTFTTARAAWLGAPLVALGIALRAAAIRALGTSFTSEIVVVPGQLLVTRGVYAWMRHPSDAGLLLVALGLSALGASLGALAITLVVVVPSVIARIHAEERALAASHEAAHARYREDVGLTPWRPWRAARGAPE